MDQKAQRRCPAHVDERYDLPLPVHCPACSGHVIRTSVAQQFQEELPVARVVVRQFDIHIGRCRRCGRRVQGRHPLQTSDALGAAAAQLGAQLIALVVVLNKQLGLSFAKIATLLQQQYAVTVTRGGLVHAFHRAARQARPSYDALCARVRGSPMVSPDETGWKVGGHLEWLWAFATPDTTVYRIQRGRGFEEAAASSGRISPACSSAMGGHRIASLSWPRTRRVWPISCAGAARCGRIIRAPDLSAMSNWAKSERAARRIGGSFYGLARGVFFDELSSRTGRTLLFYLQSGARRSGGGAACWRQRVAR
jgi:hypothetical protein